MDAATTVLEKMPELQGGVARQSVRSGVAGKIAWLIASGSIKRGDSLPSERDLAEALQVSRETVRGGIQMLAERDILSVSHGARTKVASEEIPPEFRERREAMLMNRHSLGDIHAARLLIESAVVADAAERMDEATLRALKDMLDRHIEALDDPVRFIIMDREFHLAIYNACGNQVLSEFVADLYAYMMEHRCRAMAEEGAILQSYEEHKVIFEALQARDRNKVAAAFDVHINRAPIAGTVRRVVYIPGEFFDAGLDKASEQNERQHLLIERTDGLKIGFTQIAGLIARRIVPFVKPGDTVGVGQRIGLIRFGSRVDVYLPAGTDPKVLLGQKVVAGETVLADVAAIAAVPATGEVR